MSRAVALVLSLFLVSTQGLGQTSNGQNEGSNVELETVVSGELVGLYKTRHTHGKPVGVFYNNENAKRGVLYYLIPYVMPDMVRLHEELASCKDGKKVEFPIEMWSFETRKELVGKKGNAADGKTNSDLPQFSESNLVAMPYTSYVITASNIDGKDQVIWQWPPPNVFQHGLPVVQSSPEPKVLAEIQGSCTALRDFEENIDRRLVGEVLARVGHIEIRSVEGMTDEFIRSEQLGSLFNESTTSGSKKVISHASGASAGFSIPFTGSIGANTGHTEGERIDSTHRAITANVFQNALQNFRTSSSSECHGDVEWCNLWQSAIFDRVLNKANERTAKIEHENDGTFKVLLDGYSSQFSRQDVDELIESSNDSTLKSNSSAGATIDGVPVQATQNNDYIDKRGITWHANAKNEWVPTSVKLHLVNRSEVDGHVRQAVVQATRGQIVSASYLANVLLPEKGVVEKAPRPAGPREMPLFVNNGNGPDRRSTSGMCEPGYHIIPRSGFCTSSWPPVSGDVIRSEQQGTRGWSCVWQNYSKEGIALNLHAACERDDDTDSYE